MAMTSTARRCFFVHTVESQTTKIINKDDQHDAACSICLYYACGITLHVSSALRTHHQECIETVHADSCTIVFRYGVRAGRLGDDPESGTKRTMP